MTGDGYHCATGSTEWYGHWTCEKPRPGFMEVIANELAEEFRRVTRLLARLFKVRRPRNKSTVPTALLTPQMPRAKDSNTIPRPTQQASTYG
jgi:hypothetical protein